MASVPLTVIPSSDAVVAAPGPPSMPASLTFIVPLSVIVTSVVDLDDGHRAPTSSVAPAATVQAAGQDVVLVGRRLRAHGDQGQRLAVVRLPPWRLTVVEALVGRQQRHVGDRRGEGGVEDVVGEVAAVEHAAVDQGRG